MSARLDIDRLLTARVVRAVRGWLGDGATDDAIARIAWSVLIEPGDAAAGEAIDRLGAHGALAALADPTADGSATERWRSRWDPDLVIAAAEEGARRGLTLVTPGDPAWPERLGDLGPHAPVALWIRGDASAFAARPAVALVGARAATPYGEHVTAELAGSLATDGATIVSGAAYGIDGAAHRAALQAQATTIAFVAGGADRVYPAGHANLLSRIASAGAVAAECPPGTTPTRWRFLARNRLIACVSDATVVVEAGARSGSINTAGHAAALGRPLGAVPGAVTSSTSAGCHRLMREYGAWCVTGAADVRELMGVLTEQQPLAVSSPEAVRLADALSRARPRTVDELSRRSGLAPAEVISTLGLMELEGTARASVDGWVGIT